MPSSRFPILVRAALAALLLPIGAALFLALIDRPTGAQEKPAAKGAARRDPRYSRLSDEGDAGKNLYLRYCVGCHGEKGDGQGPAAIFLFPRPRDFTKGIFKFGSTPAGSLPLDEDLLRTISMGLHGTAMPSFNLLPPSEKEALVRHLKTFSDAWSDTSFTPTVPFYPNPYRMDDPEEVAKAVAKGEKVYHVAALCWTCHAAYVSEERLKALLAEGGRPPNSRPDLSKPILKPDSWGQEIPPPDFPRVRLKSVSSLIDLYRVVMAGVGGTAMPTWDQVFKAEDIWALTLYLDSIRLGGSTHPRKP